MAKKLGHALITDFNDRIFSGLISTKKDAKKLDKLLKEQLEVKQNIKDLGYELRTAKANLKKNPKSRIFKKALKEKESFSNEVKNIFSSINNEINSLTGKNFNLTVDDGWRKYKIKFSDLALKKNPAEFILRHRLTMIEKDLREHTKKVNRSKNPKKKKSLKKQLLGIEIQKKRTEYNIKLIEDLKSGKKTKAQIKKEFEDKAKYAGTGDGKYPITYMLVGEDLDLY